MVSKLKKIEVKFGVNELTEEITQRKGFRISPFLIVYRGSLLDIEPSFGLTHGVVLVRIS